MCLWLVISTSRYLDISCVSLHVRDSGSLLRSYTLVGTVTRRNLETTEGNRGVLLNDVVKLRKRFLALTLTAPYRVVPLLQVL